MKQIIHNIRNQPEQIRRSILHILTVCTAVVLVLLWIYSLGSSLTNASTQAKIGQDLKPLSAIKDNMVNGYNDISQPASTTPNTDSNTPDSDAKLRALENSL